MSRRLVGGALVVTSVLVGNTGSFAATELPRAGCAKSVLDPKGDANVDYLGSGTAVPGTSSVNGLDLRAVTLRLTPENLEAYIAVEALPAALGNTETAYFYEVTLKSDPKQFRIQHVIPNLSQPKDVRPDNTQVYPRAHFGEMTGTTYPTPIDGSKAEIDQAKGYVIVRVPRAPVEAALGEKIKEGKTFTHISARTALYVTSRIFNADATATPATQPVYAAGNDYCFGLPPAALSGFSAAAVQYGDTTQLKATLADEAGAKLAGKQVRFAVAGEPAPLTGVTDANGVATVAYVPTRGAGTAAVTVTYAGDEAVGAAKTTGSVVVRAEATKFNALAVAKPSSTARTVTATLLDDDKRPVAGQKVDWYVNGKKVATVATDSKGRSVFKAAKPAQSVQAKFAGLAGKYAAAASTAVKV
jgi:hypothetical protein